MTAYETSRFLDAIAAARSADLDALRLDIGYTATDPAGQRLTKPRPALLLRGSSWGQLRQLVVCTATVRPGETEADAVARVEYHRANKFGPLLTLWRGRERNRRARLAAVSSQQGVA